ncbi:hypothetical protein CH253_23875 [Rhodococcus sp. 06-156-3C]|uniref:glycosyltransferase family 2 protein n=1 Tax=Nocardiaceae TaxID=85025 RepID=UPI000522F4AF|nr:MULTISPECIES: glycosyltransferase [Rhodococcus]OZD14201.1 hypothetical protein CH253_23875 [Rhodococcus sp. 06-156-3C]OZD15892.1 hypothetical protein CH280_09690 [Rhodococcus sp. 06-156-4C]OZD24537.1 hypothetical protein CH247_27990 [Rhodococcus sp. 06-156-3b]OZD28492.1 hypothetical protein CH248_00865 [Rhodococcus sp. 06-156-4a]OZD36818.1 hypothetical protein CH284_11540 [Rhodococcus sp. 06-156-3]
MPIGLVSVIIPVRNGLPHLDVQLTALAALDYDGTFEVVVSDNGSTDGLREHLDEVTVPFPLRWVDSSGTRGVSHARNVGIDAARGQFLAIVDADDAVHPNWLTALTHAASNYDAIGGAIEVSTLNSPEVATWRDIPPAGQLFATPYLPYAPGSNFAMWRRVVDIVGYFDEDFVGGGDDVDYSWRIQQAGMSLGHAPDAVVAYRLRSTLRETFRQGTSYGRTVCLLTRKHSPFGCPDAKPLPQIPAHLATIVYLTLVRNPWVPSILRPLSRGQWVHSIGLQYGALTMRLRLLGHGMRTNSR